MGLLFGVALIVSEEKLPGGIVEGFLFYIQLVTSIIPLASWIPPLQAIFGELETLNFRVQSLPCIAPFLANPLAQYIVYLTAPIVIAALIGLMILIKFGIYCGLQKYCNLRLENSKRIYPTNLFYMIGNASFFSVSLLTFGVFSCTDQGNLKAAPYFPCDLNSSSYLAMVVLSFISAAGIVAFITSIGYILIRYARSSEEDQKTLRRAFKSLVKAFKPPYYYFFIIPLLILKLSVAATIVFAEGITQVTILSLLFSLVLLSLHFARPYEEKEAANGLILFTVLVLLLTTMLGAFLDTSSNTDPWYWLRWVISILNTTVLLVYGVQMVAIIVRGIRKPKKSNETEMEEL